MSGPAVIGGKVDVNGSLLGEGLGRAEPPVHWELWGERASRY